VFTQCDRKQTFELYHFREKQKLFRNNNETFETNKKVTKTDAT